MKKKTSFVNRFKERLHGYKLVSGGVIIPGIMETDGLYVHDPIRPKIVRYLKNNYKWLLTTLIAVTALIVSIVK